MSVLSDAHIVRAIQTKDLEIDPFSENSVQPASYDIHLGNNFVTFDGHGVVNPLKDVPFGEREITVKDGHKIIYPQKFMLATTLEYVKLGYSIVARVEGVSSLGRIGLVVHSTAGYIDPGFIGQITLELFNMAPFPIMLTPGMRVAQLAFERTTGPSSGYKGRYQGQTGPTASRSWQTKSGRPDSNR